MWTSEEPKAVEDCREREPAVVSTIIFPPPAPDPDPYPAPPYLCDDDPCPPPHPKLSASKNSSCGHV
jgi:hypothetical protein